jgi:hypothetical protein
MQDSHNERLEQEEQLGLQLMQDDDDSNVKEGQDFKQVPL